MAKKYNICLDIGGTKILGVIFDQDKNIVYRIKKKTKKDGDSTDNVEKVIISVVACSPPTFPGETMTSSPPWRRSSAFRSISATM